MLTTDSNQNILICTELDTLHFDFKAGDSIYLSAVVSDNDTVQTLIVGIRKNVQFNHAYQKTHNGEIEICIPKISELVNIALAITDVGLMDSNMINHKGRYYQEVLHQFLPFKKAPFIVYLDSVMQSKTTDQQYNLYFTTKMNACTYNWEGKGNFRKDSAILQISSFNGLDPLTDRLNDFKDFADRSYFSHFFEQHQTYYDSLLLDFKKQIPVREFKNWLASQFDTQFAQPINYIKITFSPLVFGAHSMQQFQDNGFSAVLAFVAPAIKKPDSSELYNKLANWKMVFTELDHAYNNFISKSYEKQIDLALRDTKKWGTGMISGIYPAPLLIFDEYMTWGPFSLYCYDHLSPEELAQEMQYMNHFMVNRRKFFKFGAFNQALLDLYKKKSPGQRVQDLYPAIISWCKQQ